MFQRWLLNHLVTKVVNYLLIPLFPLLEGWDDKMHFHDLLMRYITQLVMILDNLYTFPIFSIFETCFINNVHLFS